MPSAISASEALLAQAWNRAACWWGESRGISGGSLLRVIHKWPALRMRPGLVGDADPGNVRAKIFAGHFAICGALDGWATVIRNWPNGVDPLVDCWSCYIKQTR